MPIKVKQNGRNPDIQEAPPLVEAEVVEEDEMHLPFQSTTNEDPEIKCNLRSFIPETSTDLEKGFRQLTQQERDEYGIKSDRSQYRVREDAGKLLGLSSQRLGQHVKELQHCVPPYPRNYLIDEQGLTPECIYEIFSKVVYTAKNILPGSPADWRSLKKSKKEFNPRWKTHRFQYLTEHTNRCRDYYNWLEAQPQPDVEVHQAEFMPDEPPEKREERFSKKRSAIQLAESESDRILRELLRARRQHHLQIVAEEVLETRFQCSQLEAKILADPDITTTPELDEDEDL